jgi:GTPase SAR1 family protein/Leucine-rich repeat (LRR) protein
MASTDKLKRVSPIDLDRLLDQARFENWQQLALVGPGTWLSDQVEDWPDSLKAAGRVLRLTATVNGLAGKLQALPGLTSLIMWSNNIGAEGAKAIAASLHGLASLNLSSNDIGDEGAKAIAASLSSLTSLDLWNNNIGDEGAKAIAASLHGLTSLNLSDNKIGDEGAKVIATSLRGLTSLNLSHNNIGDEGAKAIAASLRGLNRLALWHNDIGTEGAKAIAASLHGLTSLHLSHNNIGDRGAMAIAASLPGLTWLDLSYNNISAEGAEAIAASLHGLTSLDLSGNNLGNEGAKAIATSLHGLTWIDLSGNNLGDEGAKAIAASLHGLTWIDLSGNNLGDEGAKAIAASLHGLTWLALWHNNIGTEGIKAIAASLHGLTSLHLSRNNIGAEGAKAIAASLHGLTSLHLSHNNIGAEGAKAIAASLHGLTSLHLSHDNIGADGARALLDAWSSEERSGQLRDLDLRDNGDLGGLLPKEALETTDAQAILAAYRRFVLAQQEQTLRPLNELKLLVVGNEAVGKTSLLRYLMTGKPRDPSETKTAGIAQHEKIEVLGWSPDHCQVQLNAWDFGGQEMMRGTHRFFLTERSLYLLVLEDRRQDDRSIYDWMKTIRNRGGTSPVIVVINKSDAGKQDLRLDENGLQETYPNIAAFLRTSCDPGGWAASSIEKLRGKIVEIITRNDRLKHVHDQIPANCFRSRIGSAGWRVSAPCCRMSTSSLSARLRPMIPSRSSTKMNSARSFVCCTNSATSSHTAWNVTHPPPAVKSTCSIPIG